jgi:hypothetical protein
LGLEILIITGSTNQDVESQPPVSEERVRIQAATRPRYSSLSAVTLRA